MTDQIVPAAVKLAAKRGFVRTAAQSLATGFAVPGALTLAFTGDGLLALGLAVAGLVFSAVVNGAQSYLSILSAGIPADYEVASRAKLSVEDERVQQVQMEVAAAYVVDPASFK